MPNLKQQSQAVNSELQLLEMAKLDQAKYLKLAESLGGFRQKLRARAQTLEVKERQQILRLLVKEILVGFDTLTIRHSIPIPSGEGPPPNIPGSTPFRQPDYPLRPRGVCARAREAFEELPTRRQPGYRRRPDAKELWSFEAAGRRVAGRYTRRKRERPYSVEN
jgi:site-specific DNA recombinase